MSKECRRCRKQKEMSHFSRSPTTKNCDGLRSWCKECETRDTTIRNGKHRKLRADYSKRYRTENPSTTKKYGEEWRKNHRGYKRSYLLSRYGLTEEAFNLMLLSQGGVCAACGSDKWGGVWNKPNIDHCHKTGKVRGVLCGRCNRVLGLVRDDTKLLKSLINYLLKTYGST